MNIDSSIDPHAIRLVPNRPPIETATDAELEMFCRARICGVAWTATRIGCAVLLRGIFPDGRVAALYDRATMFTALGHMADKLTDAWICGALR